MVTGIGGAQVGVIALQFSAGSACSVRALVPDGAHIPVIALKNVVHAPAARILVAAIIGTGITVIAIEEAGGNAPSPGTLVSRRARVGVAADCQVGHVRTPRLGQTAIIGALVSIVASKRSGEDATTQMTVVTHGAHVIIVARCLVDTVDTSLLGLAGIGGTHVVVITIEEAARHALTGRANVAGCTLVAVAAIGAVELVNAQAGIPTRIVGAEIAVITIHQRSRHAQAIHALVVQRT